MCRFFVMLGTARASEWPGRVSCGEGEALRLLSEWERDGDNACNAEDFLGQLKLDDRCQMTFTRGSHLPVRFLVRSRA